MFTSVPPQLACGTVNFSKPTTFQPSFLIDDLKLVAMFRLYGSLEVTT